MRAEIGPAIVRGAAIALLVYVNAVGPICDGRSSSMHGTVMFARFGSNDTAPITHWSCDREQIDVPTGDHTTESAPDAATGADVRNAPSLVDSAVPLRPAPK